MEEISPRFRGNRFDMCSCAKLKHIPPPPRRITPGRRALKLECVFEQPNKIRAVTFRVEPANRELNETFSWSYFYLEISSDSTIAKSYCNALLSTRRNQIEIFLIWNWASFLLIKDMNERAAWKLYFHKHHYSFWTQDSLHNCNKTWKLCAQIWHFEL